MSLTKKLILAFLLVTVVPLGVVIWVSHRTFVGYAERQVGTRLEDSVVQAGRDMDEFILGCIRDMKALAADPDLITEDRDDLDKRLSRFTYTFPYFDEFMLVDATGVVVASHTHRQWERRCSLDCSPGSMMPGISLSRHSIAHPVLFTSLIWMMSLNPSAEPPPWAILLTWP